MATQKRANELGPTGVRLARIVRELREERGLTLVQLSQRLTQLGRPIPPLSLRRIEAADDDPDDRKPRRVDVDDLIALALALDVTPNRLLVGLEGDGKPEELYLTSEYRTTLMMAWRWGQGLDSLLANHPDPRVKDLKRERPAFQARNLPDFLLSELHDQQKAQVTLWAQAARRWLAEDHPDDEPLMKGKDVDGEC